MNFHFYINDLMNDDYLFAVEIHSLINLLILALIPNSINLILSILLNLSNSITTSFGPSIQVLSSYSFHLFLLYMMKDLKILDFACMKISFLIFFVMFFFVELSNLGFVSKLKLKVSVKEYLDCCKILKLFRSS